MFKFIQARTPSDIVDPSTTLGIEITDASVAARCGLGNVDGQHGMPSTSKAWAGKAAVEIALGLSIDQYLPFEWVDVLLPGVVSVERENGETGRHLIASKCEFATSGPDVDSIGAMAILVLRSIGLAESIDRELVATIAKVDSFRPGGDWAPTPLPTEANPWPSGAGSVDSTKGVAHLGVICSPRNGDIGETMSLADRVLVMAWALVRDSHAHEQLADRWSFMRPIAEACGSVANIDADHVLAVATSAVVESRRALARQIPRTDITALQLARGNYRADMRSQAQADDALRGGPILGDRLLMGSDSSRDIAIVRVSHAGALGLGYCVAPVVVAFDRGVDRKVTIAAHDIRYLDVVGLKADLNRRESEAGGSPNWGGPPVMCSSPQNGGTCLSDDVIIAAVARHSR